MEEAKVEKSVGTILREARLAQGKTLEDIEKATNIRQNLLAYLENDEYEKTPGEFFVKGAIRSYGNYLGLNGPELVEQYKASASGKELHEVEAQGIREASNVTMKLQLKDKRDIGSGTGKLDLTTPREWDLPWKEIAMGVAGLAFMGALYFAVPAIINWSKEKPSKPAVTTTAPAQQKKDVKASEPVAALDKLTLEIKASGSCWLEVNADGKRVAEIMLREGDVKTYEAKENLTVKYGNIASVVVKINGTEQNLRGERGVYNMIYTKESVEKLLKDQEKAQAEAEAATATTSSQQNAAPEATAPQETQPKAEAPAATEQPSAPAVETKQEAKVEAPVEQPKAEAPKAEPAKEEKKSKKKKDKQ